MIAAAVWGKAVDDEPDNGKIIEVDYSITSTRIFRRPRRRLAELEMDIVSMKTYFHISSSHRIPSNADNQLPFYKPALVGIFRRFCQVLSIPVLLFLVFYLVSNSCPTNQTVLIPRLAVYWEGSLRHMIKDL